MPETTYSLWDTLVELRTPRPAAFGFTPRDVREKRCFIRTRPFSLAATGTIEPDLAEDLRRRRDRWERLMEQLPEDRDRSGSNWSWGDLIYFAPDDLLLLGGAVGLIAAGFGVVLLVIWTPLHLLRWRRRARCRAALGRVCCPDCQYDLRGLDDAIRADWLNHQHSGPARCPECGSPWPLIPPPVRLE